MGWQESELAPADLAAHPVAQYRAWLADAEAAGLAEPQAAVLVTATPDGSPSGRNVLVRRTDDERGFGFFTNRRSRKGREIEVNPQVALVVGWIPLHRQITVRGTATLMGEAESDAYFAERPRGSQLAAWASDQSEVIADRAVLLERVAEEEARWAGRAVERPPHWGGWWVRPEAVEVWHGRPSRLHDRLRYRRSEHAGGWTIDRLAP